MQVLLADALTMRKDLDKALHAASIRATATGEKGYYSSAEFTLDVGKDAHSHARELQRFELTSDIMAEMIFLTGNLWVIDSAIHETNSKVSISVPRLGEWFTGNPAMSLDQALLLRHRLNTLMSSPILKAAVSFSSYYQLDRAHEGRMSQSAANQSVERWVATFGRVHPRESAKFKGGLAEAVRVIDSLIQAANWSTKLELPDNFSATYIPAASSNPKWTEAEIISKTS